MKENFIPSKIKLISFNIKDKSSVFFGKNVGILVDCKATKSIVEKRTDELLRSLSLKEDVTENKFVLKNTKIKINLIPLESEYSIFNYRIRYNLFPYILKSDEINEEFICFTTLENLVEIITKVGNVKKGELLGNFCVNEDSNFNNFGKLVVDDLGDSDIVLAKRTGYLRDVYGKTTKWIPGHVYYQSSKYCIYLGVYTKNLISNGSNNLIDIKNNKLFNYYYPTKLTKNHHVFVTTTYLRDIKKMDISDFFEDNFIDSFNNINSKFQFLFLNRANLSPGVDCGEFLTDLDNFNLDDAISDKSEEVVRNNLKISGKLKREFTAIIPDIVESDIDLLKVYLKERVRYYKSNTYRDYSDFESFCRNNSNSVRDLVKSEWIKSLSKEEVMEYCNKIYKE